VKFIRYFENLLTVFATSTNAKIPGEIVPLEQFPLGKFFPTSQRSLLASFYCSFLVLLHHTSDFG
jgi:hypothetical protein